MASLSGLLNSIMLLLALGVIYDALYVRKIADSQLRQLVTGLLIGTIGIVLMLTPWEFKPGVFFDTRWVLISVSAVFFGRNVILVAVAMMVSLRLFQGGAGIYVGSWVIVSSAAIGILFRFLHDQYSLALTWKSLYVFALVIELNVLLSMLMLPAGLALPVVEALAPMLLTLFPIGSVLLGMLLLRQEARWQHGHELAESQRLLAQERGILKGLIDSIPELIFYKSANGKYLGCNKSFEKFVGMTEREIVGHTAQDLFEPDIASALEEHDQDILSNHETINDERWRCYPDGEKVLLNTIKAPFYIDDDKVYGIVGISHDCTQRDAEHAKLRESELTYRSIIRTAIDGFWIVSLDGVIEEANQAYYDMSGYSKEELCGMRVSEVDALYGEVEMEQLTAFLIAGNEQIHISKHRRKDGSTYDVEVNITYWPSDSGGKFFAFIRDITERKQAQDQLLQSEARFRRVFESIPKIAVQGYDKNREVIFWNNASESIYGYSQQEALGKKLEDLIIPDSVRDVVVSEVNEWLRGGDATPASELTLHDAKGNPVTVFSTHVMINGINDEREMYCVDIDLRAQKAAELRATTLSQAIEQSPMSVIITNPSGVIEYVNGTFERTSGYVSHEVVNQPVSMLRSDKTPDAVYKQLTQALRSGRPWQGEFESLRRNGESYWEQVHLAPVTGLNKQVTHYLAVTNDITQQKQQEQKILQQAHFDSLTGLPNRFLALDRLSQMLADAKRNRHKAAVLFLDFDDFKKVNDTLGHQIGDELLIEAARRLESVVRDNDVVGRLGGDEFIVLVKQENEAGTAAIVAEKLLEQFRKPFNLDGRDLVSTVSIGIAVYPQDGQTPAELLRQADSAMYHSKGEGRNTFHFYTEKMNVDVAHRVLIEEQLRLALSRNELYIHYQPLINLATRQVVGAEALIRWDNDQLGSVGPDEFIPIAEQTGLIGDIGLFVLYQAMKQVAHWRLSFNQEFRIAINVSPVQFRDRTLQDEVYSQLKFYHLPPSAIELEITEGVLVSGYANVESSLNEFSERGISIAMDDFGTGYSSLSYLRNYPFNTLKVDKSFVEDISFDGSDIELVSAAVCMGHGLHLKVVAEGIENQQQLDVLTRLNCDIGQGYFFGRPVTADEFEQRHFKK